MNSSAAGISVPDVTVVIVSFNTRDMTLKALSTLLEHAGNVSMQVIVWDNASHDGSADAVAERFPQAELIRSADNVGFGQANNAAAERARADWILLLNSDTETFPGAVEQLLHFARQHPQAGIVGGRTLYADGSLNPTSCFNRMSPWGLFCRAVGLSALLPNSAIFNPELIGGWQRDSVRHVDIITGCLLLLPTTLWRELGGFESRYFMYGEDNDLCLRAIRLGYRPMFTPECEIIHHGGGSIVLRETKLIQLLCGRATLIRDHWRPLARLCGLAFLQLYVFNSLLGSQIRSLFGHGHDNVRRWQVVWQARREWRKGY